MVLWFYWEGNDLSDLTQEFPFLPGVRRYLEDADFRQGLASRQQEIDAGLGLIADPDSVDMQRSSIWKSLRSVFTLRELRKRIVQGTGTVSSCLHSPNTTMENLEWVLKEGDSFVDSLGGEMHLVYLPAWTRFAEPGSICNFGNDDFTRKGEVISIAEKLGINVIDVTGDFGAHPDPLSVFPFRINNHYNEEGYALVAERVIDGIEIRPR